MLFEDDPEDAWSANDPPVPKFAILKRLRDQIAQEVRDPAHDKARERHRLSWALKRIEELEESGADLDGLDALELALLDLIGQEG